jgi:uncharacterized membrane protein
MFSMLEKLLSSTALPNLHPAVVHFPIALLTVAIAFDVACLVLRREWLDRSAAALYALGALGAWAAYLAGDEAAEGLGNVPAAVGRLIDEHEEWALRTLITFAIVAAARLLITWRERRQQQIGLIPARAAIVVAALGGLWMLVQTAERGGALVYRNGVAVSSAPAGAPAAAAPPAAKPLN